MLRFNIFPVGMAAARAKVAALGPATDKAGPQALWAIAEKVEARAKELSLDRYQSGDMYRSIHCIPTSRGITCYSDLDYAYWQEFGFFNKQAGRWVPGLFFMTRAIGEYVESKAIQGSILDSIEKQADKMAIAGAAAGVAAEMAGMAAVFGVLSFLLMGFAALFSSRG